MSLEVKINMARHREHRQTKQCKLLRLSEVLGNMKEQLIPDLQIETPEKGLKAEE